MAQQRMSLQERTQVFLEQLSSGYTLQLAATRAATSAGAAAQERISKTVHVRMQHPDTGAIVLRERSIRSATQLWRAHVPALAGPRWATQSMTRLGFGMKQ